MNKPRKHYTAEEKVAVLRRHLAENEPVSKLSDELGIKPTLLYRWQKEFFENGAAAFQEKGVILDVAGCSWACLNSSPKMNPPRPG